MKIIQHTQLRLIEGTSDKVYEVDLCEQSNSNEARFLVNFRYGRYGKNLREGTKTTNPVTHDKAIKIFDSLVVAKVNKGYQNTSLQSNASTDPENSLDNDSDFIPLATTSAQNTIVNYLHNPPKNWKLSRIVWRAGDFDLLDAGDKIVEIANSAKKLTDDKEEMFLLRYSCLWALASCGQARHLPAIKTLKGDTNTQALNLSVQLILAEDKKPIINELLTQLPKEMAEAIRTDDLPSLVAMLIDASNQRTTKVIEQDTEWYYRSIKATIIDAKQRDMIVSVYQLGYAMPMCKQAIVQLLNQPQDTPHFDFVKKILKFSQLYRDGEIFAQCLQLIQQYRPKCEYNWRNNVGFEGDSFQQRDIDYHRRRSWRSLRKLGEADNMAYVAFAEHILLTVSDSDATSPQSMTSYRWDYDSRRDIKTTKHYGRFPKLMAFNAILFSNSEHIIKDHGLSWSIDKSKTDTGRTEAFSHLWDKVPERLLNLLLQSHCEEVHSFAIKALTDNTAFCDALAERINVLEQLLASTYDSTASFALERAKVAYTKTANIALLIACLNAQYLPAQEQAVAWLQDTPALLTTDFSLYALAMVLSKDLPQLSDCFAQISLNDAEQQQLMHAVITYSKQQTTMSNELVQYLIAQLVTLIPQTVQGLALQNIDALLSEPSEHCQLLGAWLLLENNVAIADIPESLLTKINQSESDTVQATAISMLKKLTDEQLLDKYNALLSCVVSHKKLMREAVLPVLERLADNTEFTTRLLADLVPYTFRGEPVDGFHDDLLTLCQNTLHTAVANLDSKLRWRLLNAQSKTAKKLGAMYIEHVSVDSYSVKQWALLGANETLNVRQYVWQIYNDNVALIQQHMNDALRLLNTKWDDSRSFALNYFREQLADTDWTADLIICVCDNTFADVELLGRELLTRCFKEGDGVQYLMQLSQHPTQNVQLFTTNFLTDYASDDLQRLQQLKPYFITVLSQVFKGRVAKNRVITFLNNEALKDEMVAHLVADIYTRQSVTMAITDKAQYIEGMQELRAKYPTLNLPIQIKELAVKGKSRSSVSG